MNNQRLQQLISFVEQDPTDPFLRYALAMEYLKLGKPAKAEELFRHLLTNHPDYVGTYYHFGKLLVETDRTPEALEVYAKGKEVAAAAGEANALRELKEAEAMARAANDDDDDEEW